MDNGTRINVVAVVYYKRGIEMKAKTTKAIEIEDIGVFVAVEEWNGMTKYNWVLHDGYIIVLNKADNIFDSLLKGISIQDGDNDITIILCTNNVAEELNKIEKEYKDEKN